MANKKYHQFIITGASTAGKSTFSHELIKKYHVQHICLDPIIDAFQSVFPQLGITHEAPNSKSHKKVCQNLQPFIFKMLDELKFDNFVIEGFRLPLKEIHAKYPHLQYFAFGFPNSTPQERISICKKHDTNNWTNEIPDKELLKIMQFLIDESKQLQKTCKKLNLPFINTSKNYSSKIKEALGKTR